MRILPTLIVVLLLTSLTSVQAEFSEEPFGTTADGKPVKLFKLKNQQGMEVEIISRGATIRAIRVPDADGNLADVCNGFDDVAGYESDRNQYFGCVAGRVCNRIGGAKFELYGETFQLTANDGDNTLHGGGAKSLDKLIWEGTAEQTEHGASVILHCFSADGDEGFPGNLHASVRYTLIDNNALVMVYEASTDVATPVNLTNHAYFNLGGHGNGTILDHELMIAASAYTPTDEELIPTGKIEPVEGTPLDFRQPTRIGDRIDQVAKTAALGYDHNWVLKYGEGVRLAARLVDPESGRVLSVLTDQPGLQFYSGNFLKGQKGKDGKIYEHRGALCLETQHFPDSVNHPDFPSTILEPGRDYYTTTIYRFSTQ